MRRRTTLRGVGAAIALAGGLSLTSVAKPPSGRGPPADVVVPDDYATIQDAVDAASAGDTVLVDGGTYREQVLIDTDLTLKGQDGATIEAPESLDTYTLAESGSTWAPLVYAYGGTASGGEVSGSATVDVTLSGFTVDGRGDTGQSGRKTGVLYRNVTGASVTDTAVENVGTPGGSIGIVVYGDSDVRIADNDLTGFGRGGIGANGDGGDHPSPTVTIRDNLIDAESDAGGSAPNGVQVGYGATGTVAGNTIRNCRYSEDPDSTWQASGVLVFESDGVQVKRNTLENNDVGVAASAWGWFGDSADNNTVVRNTITDALIGVNLRATAWGPYSSADPSVSNNKVVNNDLEDTDGAPTGATGIAVESNDDHDEYGPVARNNKVVRNSVSGFDDQVSNEGSETKIRAIEP